MREVKNIFPKKNLLFNVCELKKINYYYELYVKEVENLIREIESINLTDVLEVNKILTIEKINSRVKVIEKLFNNSYATNFLTLYNYLFTERARISKDLRNLGIYFDISSSYLSKEKIILDFIEETITLKISKKNTYNAINNFGHQAIYLNVKIEEHNRRKKLLQSKKPYIKQLRLKEITIKGWRSFKDTHGISLKNLKNINIIVGTNNIGKSNIFKYFYHWSLIFPNEEAKEDEWNNFHLENHFKKEDRWMKSNTNVSSKFLLEETNVIGKNIFKSNYQYLKYASNNKGKNFFNSSFLNPNIKLNFSIDEKEHVKDSWNKLLKIIEYIGPMRDFEGETKGAPAGGVVDAFLDNVETISGNRILFNDFKNKMDEWLSRIFMETTEVVKVSLESDYAILTNRFVQIPRIVVSQKREGEVLKIDLSNMGTGISQIIVILTHLYMRKFYEQSSLIVFLEEPESNLHPRALSNFIELLDDEFKEFQFFISTHSNVLINQIEKDWKVFNVTKLQDRGVVAIECLLRTESYKALNELGVLPSHLLLSNFVIWIEGPTDRIYLKKWIEFFSNNKLKENFHYSFEMYGGSSFKNFSVDNDTKADEEFSNSLINLMKSSRYNAIICDSDRISAKKGLNKKAYLLKNKIERDVDLKEFCMVWITDGRDIENYIPESLLLKCLKFRTSIHKKKIKFKKTASIGIYDEFEEFYSKMYIYEKNGRYVKKASYLKSFRKSFTKQKVTLATKVTSQWNQKSYFSPALSKRVSELVDKICEANQL
ncbi:ATP-dependent nuclease [Priestia aryabhattai]|uniref:ATP-dependent nuclease n=1 Tax=Priestia aryabhattai TaxID=412384 RepID=UPI001C8DC356|nr:AAA family ATPase [Priestia aryabhattai]MBX9985566.1 ATP-binding protein [Priestia aryabhattai]